MNTYEECRVQNKTVGSRYIAMSKKVDELVTKLKQHKANPIEGVDWDLDQAINTYSSISKRWKALGEQLVAIGF